MEKMSDKEWFETQGAKVDAVLKMQSNNQNTKIVITEQKQEIIPEVKQSPLEKLKEKTLTTPKSVSIEELIKQSASQLKMALPEHMRPERIVRIALTTLRMNPKLYQCNPQSFLGALFQSAQLGLEPNLNGEAWIIPYMNKGQLMAQFQIGAYGLVKLFWNHQNSVSLQIEKVHEKDEFSYDLGSGELSHKPPMFSEDRGEVIGYYASAQMKNGGRAIKVLSVKEAKDFGKKFSKCWDKQAGKFQDYTPWASHFDSMAMKTVLKMLMKILPKSIEIQRALAMDETVKTKIESNMVEVPNEIDYNDAKQIENEGEVK